MYTFYTKTEGSLDGELKIDKDHPDDSSSENSESCSANLDGDDDDGSSEISESCSASLDDDDDYSSSEISESCSASLDEDDETLITSNLFTLQLDCGYTKDQLMKAKNDIKCLNDGKNRGIPCIQWYSDYGCAIIFHSDPTHWSNFISIDVIGLDGHRQEIHTGENKYEFTSAAHSFVILHVGETEIDKKDDFVQKFTKLFQAKREKRGKDRSAAFGKQGHQRTPAFIHAVARQALNCDLKDASQNEQFYLPVGGLTDVGMHTGGQMRDTCYALARSVFRWFLEQAAEDEIVDVSFDAVMVHFKIYLVEKALAKIDSFQSESSESDHFSLNHCFIMLQSVVEHAVCLPMEKYDLSSTYDTVKNLRNKIEASVVQRENAMVEKYSITPCQIKYSHPRFSIPSFINADDSRYMSKSSLTKLILKNLGRFSQSEKQNKISSCLEWAKQQKDNLNCSKTLFIFLRQIENLFWHMSKQYLDRPLHISNTTNVMALVDLYREGVEKYLTSSFTSKEKLSNCIRSVEVLLVWLGYCLLFHSVSSYHEDIMDGFGVALDYRDLRHLVLHDSLHIEVLEKVIHFLNSKYIASMKLFFIDREEDWDSPTFEMGYKYSCRYLNKIWEDEDLNAKKRMEVRWYKILLKKNQVRNLQKERSDLEEQFETAKAEERTAISYNRQHYNRWEWDEDLDAAKEKRRSIYSLLERKKEEIQKASRAPSAIIQPLPKDKVKAMKVLFFLFMPAEFQNLSRITLTAQQLLILPKPCHHEYVHTYDGRRIKYNILKALKLDSEVMPWKDHFEEYQESDFLSLQEVYEGEHQFVDLSMKRPVPRISSIGSRDVQELLEIDDGVWYPDDCNVCMVWRGGCHSWDQYCHDNGFNPFNISSRYTAPYFTEKLDSGDESLSWSVNVHSDIDIPTDYGNCPYAKQHLRPQWLSKEGYLDYTSMRRFPKLALRKLCVAIKHRSLPLEQNAVQTLFRQTLYQIGEIFFVEGKIQMNWRRDINVVYQTCSILFEDLAHVYSVKPNFYKACALIGELSNYFQSMKQFSTNDDELQEQEKFKSIRKKLANACVSWAEDTNDAVKKIIFYRISILCLVHSNIEEDEIRIILNSVVCARNVFIKSDTTKKACREMNFFQELVEYKLSNCFCSYLSVISRRPTMLETAMRSIIENAPSNLVWKKLDESFVCFTADGGDGHEYSINTFTGVVVVDGLPPSQLPEDITDDDLYKKVFGTQNFEVVLKERMFETIKPIDGYYYRFHKVHSILTIQESTHSAFLENTLELLHPKAFDSDVPLKLKIEYSQWVSRKHYTILFRAFNFRERQVYYILNTISCKLIPAHTRVDAKNWLLNTTKPGKNEFLIVHESPFLKCLAKVELPSMMHTYVEGPHLRNFKISLHRFGLTFSFDAKCSEFSCDEISGYYLCKEQYLRGNLHGFSQYLVLKSSDFLKETIIIVPFGKIFKKETGSVQIELYNVKGGKLEVTKNGSNEEIKILRYKIHPRFGHLVATNFLSRIFLAGLFIATGQNIPDIDRIMTGEEKAVEILRQCFVNRPLSAEEQITLENVMALSRCKNPTSFLLSLDISKYSSRLSFLYGHSQEVDPTLNTSTEISNEVTAYQFKMKFGHHRNLLQKEESLRCFGSFVAKFGNDIYLSTNRKIDLEPCPVSRLALEMIVKSLSSLWTEYEDELEFEKFPLVANNSTQLERTVYGELEKSWNLHRALKRRNIKVTRDISSTLKSMQSDTAAYIRSMEKYLHESINSWSDQSQFHMKLLRLVNLLPNINKREIVSTACHQKTIKMLNPLLSSKSTELFHDAVILWLEFCVLNDKVKYLISMEEKGLIQDKIFTNEICSTRSWSPCQHPYWLIFEVEQGIRIRPEQYEIAKHLMQNKQCAVQLNMGLGKTRVIIPMLILFWTYSKKYRQMPRLCILSTLLEEACEYFQNSLSASVLDRKLFLIPFQRDIEIDEQKATLLKDMVQHCWQLHGFVVQAPEHRLSLHLKIIELFQGKQYKISSCLEKIITRSEWCDIIDEVDEVLHHRYQLVYSIGTPSALPEVQHRWRSIQSVLKVLRRTKIKGILMTPNESNPEAYPLVLVEEDLDVKNFRLELVQNLFNDPPFEMRWLKDHSKRDLISSAIVEPEFCPTVIKCLSQEHQYDVLSLRGQIAFDILLHCLKKRYGVEYGVNENGRKRLAVPYRGADTPSKRAEFSHPDTAITLAILAYYQRGLSKKETYAAFQTLLQRGRNSRLLIYQEWLHRSKDRMNQKLIDSLSHVDMIDLTNSQQFQTLHNFFGKNPQTIEFWLNTCVFLTEIDQYPKRMVVNSWHLADNPGGQIVGFSGTNDNHWILPLQIKQYLPWDDESNIIWRTLLSTNGKMLNVLMTNTISCIELEDGGPFNALMNFIQSSFKKSEQLDGIIDAGALLVGNSNYCVAKSIMKHLLLKNSSRLKGVTFFNQSEDSSGCWMILDKTGRCLPKDQSPIPECETFVIFDEPRCRGVDLKLDPNIIVAITLGNNMCKSKFLQAAGRLRQLESSQKLIIVGQKKIFADIRTIQPQDTECSVQKVLSWIMNNTINAIRNGLETWCKQGAYYATTKNHEHFLLDEALDLETFYGQAIHNTSIADQALASMAYHAVRTRCFIEKMTVEIYGRCIVLGDGYLVKASQVDEECEREVQREAEQEEQQVMQLPKMTARCEKEWNYKHIFSKNISDLLKEKVIFLLGDAIKTHMSCESLSLIKWSKRVYCTRNFFKTIETKGGHLDKFLRIPDCYIGGFDNGKIVLISDREADGLLEEFWSRNDQNCVNGLWFGHCAFEQLEEKPLMRYGSLRESQHVLTSNILCTIHLFNGECDYKGANRKTMKRMLSCANANKLSSTSCSISKASCEPINLVSSRGKNCDYDRSPLEQICIELACEYEMESEITVHSHNEKTPQHDKKLKETESDLQIN